MGRRTQVQDHRKIEKASDLENLIQDKRRAKRANKKKAKRRNRHYGRTILRHLAMGLDGE
jgi:hypothetical protein